MRGSGAKWAARPHPATSEEKGLLPPARLLLGGPAGQRVAVLVLCGGTDRLLRAVLAVLRRPALRERRQRDEAECQRDGGKAHRSSRKRRADCPKRTVP